MPGEPGAPYHRASAEPWEELETMPEEEELLGMQKLSEEERLEEKPAMG